MENFETLRKNILIDAIPSFVMGVRESKNCEEIRVSSRKMFETIIESAFPGQEMSINPIRAKDAKMDKAPSPIEKCQVETTKKTK